LILTIALMISLPGTGQIAHPDNHPEPNSNSRLSQKDRLFLHAIASEDQSEIDLANLALRKSTNPKIQEYARSKILAADPAMKTGALQVAEQNHATISSEPNAAARAQYADFSVLSGNVFDRSYVKYEYRMQTADLKVVQHAASSSDNPQVGSYAKKEVTPVQQAADAAKQLAQEMKVTKTS